MLHNARGCKPEELLGDNGLLKQLTKAVLERALQAELTHHLGYDKRPPSGNNSGNSRNGRSKKTLKGEFGNMPVEVPRDRNSSFEPRIIPKGQTRFDGFDDKVLSLYARGMTTRQIQQHLEEIYQAEVSPSLISSVTDAISDEVKAWQSRPLDSVYPVVYLDALMVKTRESSHIQNKAVYLAIGLNMCGLKEVLGMWIARTEGAKFWLQVLTDLKNRGVKDIFIACVRLAPKVGFEPKVCDSNLKSFAKSFGCCELLVSNCNLNLKSVKNQIFGAKPWICGLYRGSFALGRANSSSGSGFS